MGCRSLQLFLICLLAEPVLQEEDAGLGERRRQSAAGLRGPEQPLTPAMVSHIVDALFDRSAHPGGVDNLPTCCSFCQYKRHVTREY